MMMIMIKYEKKPFHCPTFCPDTAYVMPFNYTLTRYTIGRSELKCAFQFRSSDCISC